MQRVSNQICNILICDGNGRDRLVWTKGGSVCMCVCLFIYSETVRGTKHVLQTISMANASQMTKK